MSKSTSTDKQWMCFLLPKENRRCWWFQKALAVPNPNLAASLPIRRPKSRPMGGWPPYARLWAGVMREVASP